MNIPTKKLKSGFEMPVFGLGTWMFGGDRLRNPNNDDKADVEAIKRAIDAGITHIDTAEGYAEGHSEELVGEAIKGYDREKLFIVTKVKKENLGYGDLIKSAKASLKRLRTTYLDLYLIHSPSLEIPIEESMNAMDFLKKEGLTKEIGVSNFTVTRFKEAQSKTQNKIVANQLHLNLVVRETEKAGLVDFCQREDVMFIAWRPVEKGAFLLEENPLMKKMVEKYNKTPAQIAINWLISQDNIVTLSKMSNPKHLEENLGALDWTMDKEDINLLYKEYPGQLDVSPAVPLK